MSEGELARGRGAEHRGLFDRWAWLEEALEAADLRLLVAVDEVDRLQDGLEEGWATPDFLSLPRAAGDQLSRIRVLVATAYPLERLGPHWVDRLVSAMQYEVTTLDEGSARRLLKAPIEGSPSDLHPDVGVDRILRPRPVILT